MSRHLCAWFDSCPTWAADWGIVIRRKTAADDRMLVEDGEADNPTRYWAVAVDADAYEVIVAVPSDADESVVAADAAGFLVELLVTVADPAGG